MEPAVHDEEKTEKETLRSPIQAALL